MATQCLLHWSSVYVPCGTYCFWGILSVSYLHYPSFFSTCGKCKLNIDDDDDGLMYRHYSLWYLPIGSFFFLSFLSSTKFSAYLILAFSPKGICLNVATVLVDCWKDFTYTPDIFFYKILGVISHWSFVKCLKCVIADSGWLWAVFLKWQLIIERPPHLPSQKYKFSPGSV